MHRQVFDADARSQSPGADTVDQPAVSLVEVSKHYRDATAVDNVSLDIRRGEFLTFLGPSGSGKTTLLRMIAGLVDPSGGELWLDGKRINERPTHERNIGMVFQSLALFPHLDVYGNIAFPLWMRRTSKAEIRRRVGEALDLVRLPEMSRRKIEELSGGQRQRVALARALVYQPTLLLLDEPLAALDQKLREEMELELISIHRQLDVTIVNVTHDQKEALRVSDRIGVMNQGRLEQLGTSVDLYRSPQTPFVATFLGNTNALSGVVRTTEGSSSFVPDTAPDTSVPLRAHAQHGDRRVLVLRAEQLRLRRHRAEDEIGFDGTVVLKAFQGNTTQFEIDVPALGTVLRVESFDRADAVDLNLGDSVWTSWSPADTTLLSTEGVQS